jgi:L-rhamnose mutarotase
MPAFKRSKKKDDYRTRDFLTQRCKLSACKATLKMYIGGLSMQRFGMAIRVKPGKEDEYIAHHRAVWPEVAEKMWDCNIRNYSIFVKDDLLFSYFEYHGHDLQVDWERMAAHAKTQEWWAIMKPLQQPFPTRKDGEWWAEMQEVCHLE